MIVYVLEVMTPIGAEWEGVFSSLGTVDAYIRRTRDDIPPSRSWYQTYHEFLPNCSVWSYLPADGDQWMVSEEIIDGMLEVEA